MGEEYQIPEMEVIVFSSESNVITSSNETPFVPFNLNTAEENSTF